MKKRNRAFTLIELLVVVLIIGILAAVAVPQYQKAVEKSRLTEALQLGETLQSSLQIYLLTNGFPSDETRMLNANLLDVEPLWAQCGDDNTDHECQTKFFDIFVNCYSSYCQTTLNRLDPPYSGASFYELVWEIYTDGSSYKACFSYTNFPYSRTLCNFLENQGFCDVNGNGSGPNCN